MNNRSAKPSDIVAATTDYERWLAAQIQVVSEDLREKHRLMAEAPFPFLRATFYRWMQLWPHLCSELLNAPALLAIGDLHIENFGTWRDIEGRLIWGVNDFDEAFHLPYSNDLVRLASSALLAIEAEHIALKPKQACAAILEGYREALRGGGQPFVLAERHCWLRDIAVEQLAAPNEFWSKMEAWPEVRTRSVPVLARKLLEYHLPAKRLKYRVVRRQVGLGSLGHQRLVALMDWGGGKVAREAKALAPAAPVWLSRKDGAPLRCADVVRGAVRIADSTYTIDGCWVVRRLAPDCRKVTLANFPAKRNELRMLHAMGWETANVHLGNRSAVAAVQKDLDSRPERWLHRAAKRMSAAVRDDWKEWRDYIDSQPTKRH